MLADLINFSNLTSDHHVFCPNEVDVAES